MIKIACLPDLHAWYSGPKDEQERIREFRACMDEIVNITTAAEQKVDYCIVPGDLFVSNRPAPTQVHAVVNYLMALNNPVITAGNHDVCAPGSIDFVGIIKQFIGIDMSIAPNSFRADDTSFVAIPFIKGLDDDQLLMLLHAQVAAMPPADHKIVVAHYATDISTYSSGEMALGKEPILRMADLEALPIDLVVLGHIHNPRILNDTPGQPQTKPIILHTGALTRRDHGEAKDQRGFYIITLDEKPTIEFFPLPAREFVTIDPTRAKSEDWQQCNDAYVRFQWSCTEEEWKVADTTAWHKKAEENGAFYITGYQPKIDRIERTRAEGLTEQTSPLQGLKMWLDNQQITSELRAAVIVEFEQALEEVEQDAA